MARPPNPAATAKRRANLVKARDTLSNRSKARKAAKAAGLPNPYPKIKPVAGKRFTFDDVVTAVLEADDALESRRIVEAMQRESTRGNVKAAEFLVERALGKPLQKVQLSGGLTLETMDAVLPGPKAEAKDDVPDPISAD